LEEDNVKKLSVVLSLLVVFSMLLAACGQAAPAPATEAPAAPEAPAATEAPAGKPFEGQTLNFLTIQPHNVAAQNLADWFKEETGATVNLIVVPYDNVIEKAVLDVTSGAAQIDVVEYWYPGLGTLVENDVLENLDEWWASKEAELNFADYFEDYRDVLTTINGSKYGIPYDGDMHLLWYNKELFAKHNVVPPTTWDEYLTVCKTITEAEKGNDVYGCAIMGAKIPLILIGTYLSRLGSYGGTFLDADGAPVINSPEAVAALEALVAQQEFALPTPSAVAFDEALGGWFTGKVGMVEFWTDLGTMTDAPDASVIGGKWGVVALPKGSGDKAKVVASLNAGFGMGVSTTAPNKDLAYAFLEFVARPDITLRYNTVVGGIDPVRKSTLDDPTFIAFAGEELVAAIKEGHKNLAPWSTDALWFKLQEPLTDNLSLALTGDKTPQQALDDTQAAWEKIIAENK